MVLMSLSIPYPCILILAQCGIWKSTGHNISRLSSRHVISCSRMFHPCKFSISCNDLASYLLASFCLGRHWVCAFVVIPWSSCNGDCGCRAQSASGRSSCRSGTQRLCRPRYPMLPSLVCAASSSRVAHSVSVLFWPLQILWSTSTHFGQQPRLQGR